MKRRTSTISSSTTPTTAVPPISSTETSSLLQSLSPSPLLSPKQPKRQQLGSGGGVVVNTMKQKIESTIQAPRDSKQTPTPLTKQQQQQQHTFTYNVQPTASSSSSSSNSYNNNVENTIQQQESWWSSFLSYWGGEDRFNYILLIALYTLQGIPMGLSASIPFLIQQKIQHIASLSSSSSSHHHQLAESVISVTSQQFEQATTATAAAAAAVSAHSVQRDSYNANAIFALCTWPFSLKLLWAPIVDACYFKKLYGRRKSWIVPVQSIAGLLMIYGSQFVEQQLGLGHSLSLSTSSINVKGVTIYFFVLYFLMATQDIAVDGWALTMLSKMNRGHGPICNSIGQNIGYFISFVGFLALNDVESCEQLWRPLFGLPSNPETGLISLGSFIRCMGYFMLIVTSFVAFFKRELLTTLNSSLDGKDSYHGQVVLSKKDDNDSLDENNNDDKELDASEIGLQETYHRLYSVCTLPSVQWLFIILLTYRLPTSLSDNVKFLKAVEYGLSKSTTALLSPTVILPLGIIVPIVATRIWHNSPLQQFMTAYQLRVTLVPIFDTLMLLAVRGGMPNSTSRLVSYWSFIILSTALQAITSSMQFNAQMTFFAKRVDPAIGGSYMTLLNTAANLGGTWPSSFVMWLMGMLSKDPICTTNVESGLETCTAGYDPYFHIQIAFSMLGMLWIFLFSNRVKRIENLPDDAWRTHVATQEHPRADSRNHLNPPRFLRKQTKSNGDDEESMLLLSSVDVELVPKRK